MEFLTYIKAHPEYIFFLLLNLAVIVWSFSRVWKKEDDSDGDNDDGGQEVDRVIIDLPPGVSLPTNSPQDTPVLVD